MNSTTALLVIDVQVGLDDPGLGGRNNPEAEMLLGQLLSLWRGHGWPVVHVQHLSTDPGSPLRPGQPGVELKPVVRPAPGEPLVQKRVSSAFIGTDLETRLRAAGVGRLVFGGMMTDHCVASTARMAADLGFDAMVLCDATATFDRVGPDGRAYSAQTMHDTALASLHQEFATIAAGEELLWQDAVQGLLAGDFSRLAHCFEPTPGPDPRPLVLRWHQAGRFQPEPAALAEALTCAAFLGRTHLVEYLLGAGVTPSGGTATGLDALHWAANRGQLEAVRILVRHGAALESVNRFGGTVLGTAVWSAINEPRPAHPDVIDFLLEAGARVEGAGYPTGDRLIDQRLEGRGRHG